MINTKLRHLKKLNRTDIIFMGLILTYTILSLWPLLKSGYYSDDAINSQTQAYLVLDNKSLWQFTYYYFNIWIKNGRFYPLAWYLYSVFTLIDSLIIYKITIMFFVIINIFCFGYLIKLITRDKYVSFLAMLLMSIFFQFRIYHDPILSFHFLLQIVFLYICLSLIVLMRFYNTKSKWLYILSIVLYIFAILTYEITYTFFVLHFLISFYYMRKLIPTIKYSIPYASASFITILISFYLRSKVAVFDAGYTINLNVRKYITTLIKQVFSSLPLSYYITDPSKVFLHSIRGIINNIELSDFFTVIIFSVTIIYIFKKLMSNNQTGTLYMGTFGLMLMILPGVMISLAPKHQDMVLGIGYLPVYIQYFGASMLLLVLIIWLLNKSKLLIIKKIIKTSIITILIFLNILNLQNNRIVVEQTNVSAHYPRIVLSEALKSDMLNNVPENSTILVNGRAAWDNKYFFYLNTKKQYNVVNIVDYLKEYTQNIKSDNKYILDDFSKDKVFILRYYSNDANEGYAILSEVKDVLINLNNYDIPQINVKNIRISMRGNTNNYNSIVCKTYSYNKSNEAISNEYSNLIIPLNKMNILNNEGDNILYELINDDSIFEFNSIGFCSTKTSEYSNYNIFRTPQDKGNHDISQLLLKSSKSAVTHLKVDDNNFIYDYIKNAYIAINENKYSEGINGKAIEFSESSNPISINNINVDGNFTLEMILYPYKNKIVYSAIVGNHPGLNYYEGFVLQQDGSADLNSFTFSLGNGKSWAQFTPSASFKLEPDMWHFIAISVSSNTINIYDNGICIKSCKYDGGVMKNSEMPLFIGNWINKDRPFQGLIEEVLISNNVKSDTDILETWNSIKAKVK